MIAGNVCIHYANHIRSSPRHTDSLEIQPTGLTLGRAAIISIRINASSAETLLLSFMLSLFCQLIGSADLENIALQPLLRDTVSHAA